MKSASFILAALVFACTAASSGAQDYDGQSITAVYVSGLERISEQAVRARLEVQAGQAFNARAISRDIRRLYEQGYYNNIRAEANPEGAGVAVTYVIEEKQVVAEVKLTGNRKIKDRRILGVLTLRPGSPFIAESLDDERQAVIDFYESKGFANTTVDIAADKAGPSRVRITYIIDEGRKAKITAIAFEGNEALSDRELRKLMETKKRRWWFLGGKYDEATFERDLVTILDEYGDHGRLEADIAATEVYYTGTGKSMNITIRLEEGPEYRVDSLQIANNIVYDEDELLRIVEVDEGQIHNRSQVNEDAQTVEQGYQDSGYVNANVAPQVTLDRENKTTNIVHNISEGDLRYVREIEISGNEVTKDEIIRRQITLTPDERFDGTELDASQRRLERLGFFERTRLTLNDVSGDRYTDVLVDVEEGRTGTFNFGGGFSTDDGFTVFGELRLNNFDITNWPTFSGGGQQFRSRISIGDRRDSYFVGWTDPEFLGYPFLFGVDVYDESYQVRGGADYREDERGINLRWGKTLSDYVQVRGGLRFVETDISELPFFVNRELREERGSSTTISNYWTIERNTVDSLMDPTQGTIHILGAELAGLGGDNDFYKLEHDFTWYKRLDEQSKWVLSLRTREGFVDAYGNSDRVPLQDRFYAGGTNTVRGFRNREIGPYVREFTYFGDRFHTGGELRWLTNAEIRYKLSDLLRIYGFWDAGGVWADASDFDFGDMKYSAGIGLGFDIPRIGPIRVDYGYPLNPEDYQSSGRLHLSTGFRF